MQWALRLGLLVVLGAVAMLTAGLMGVAGASADTVELCHLPGTPDEQTLMVPQSAVGAHIGHGDVLGSCENAPRPPVLPAVLARGDLRCGVSGFAVGFSEHDVATDTWSGLDVDLCRAVAAAVLGDADAVDFVALTALERFAAVRDGTVDVLFRTTTDTLTRDATFDNGGAGVNFGPTYFYDGVTALAYEESLGDCVSFGDCTLSDLEGKGATICALADTTGAQTLLELVPDEDIDLYPNLGAMLDAFIAEDCHAIWLDQSALISIRESLPPDHLFILTNTYSKEPLASVVRDGDDEWAAVVRWAVYATFLAEELGLDSANISGQRDSSAEARRAFGTEAAVTGSAVGLGEDWGFDIVSQVGNYAEIYERNLTAPHGLGRGQNASYLDGGLLYASLIR